MNLLLHLASRFQERSAPSNGRHRTLGRFATCTSRQRLENLEPGARRFGVRERTSASWLGRQRDPHLPAKSHVSRGSGREKLPLTVATVAAVSAPPGFAPPRPRPGPLCPRARRSPPSWPAALWTTWEIGISSPRRPPGCRRSRADVPGPSGSRLCPTPRLRRPRRPDSRPRRHTTGPGSRRLRVTAQRTPPTRR